MITLLGSFKECMIYLLVQIMVEAHAFISWWKPKALYLYQIHLKPAGFHNWLNFLLLDLKCYLTMELNWCTCLALIFDVQLAYFPLSISVDDMPFHHFLWIPLKPKQLTLCFMTLALANVNATYKRYSCQQWLQRYTQF